MNISTQKVFRIIVLDKTTNTVINDIYPYLGVKLIIADYEDYLAYPDKSNLKYSEYPEYLPSSFELIQTIDSSNSELVNELMNTPEYSELSVIRNNIIETTHEHDIRPAVSGDFLIGKKIFYLKKSDFKYVVYNEGDVVKVSEPIIGSFYHEDVQIFAHPIKDYILDETTYTYRPDPNREYDLHDDGKLYKYDTQNDGWYPVN